MNWQSSLQTIALSALAVLALGSPLRAQGVPAAKVDGAATLSVRGDVEKPGVIKLAELQTLGTMSAIFKVHDHTQTVVGVPLNKVLAHFGVVPGPMSKTMAPADKRPGYKKVIVASAPDGFQSVFSLAELSEGMGKTQVLVVWESDGKPLAPALGPLRLVVLTDGEPSRSVHQLRTLDVADMRRMVPPASGQPAGAQP